MRTTKHPAFGMNSLFSLPLTFFSVHTIKFCCCLTVFFSTWNFCCFVRHLTSLRVRACTRTLLCQCMCVFGSNRILGVFHSSATVVIVFAVVCAFVCVCVYLVRHRQRHSDIQMPDPCTNVVLLHGFLYHRHCVDTYVSHRCVRVAPPLRWKIFRFSHWWKFIDQKMFFSFMRLCEFRL